MSLRYRPLNVHLVLWASGLTMSVAIAQGKPDFEQMSRFERQNLGVQATAKLHAGPMHGPTPASIPGGQIVTTQGLAALMQGHQAPYVLIDVLGEDKTLPNAVAAVWLAQPGDFGDAVQQQARQFFGQISQGRKDVPLVFYCRSRECWLSYNAALRAINAGHTNVLWYRGGMEAWQAAGLPIGPSHAMNAQRPHGHSAAAVPGDRRFVPVEPVARGPQPQQTPGQGPAQAPAQLQIGQGSYFSYAMPPGWRVGEEGPYALTLVAPDNRALTVMVGNSGLPLNQSPGDYAWRRLQALGAQNVQVSPARQARPAAGFSQAVEYDVAYNGPSGPTRGILKVSSAPGYDSTVMAMTAALSAADQWGRYASWLPLVADQVAATNGAAFGRRGIMQQNLRNSMAYGEAARQYREWSQRNWQGVTDARNESQDRRNFAFRENIGGVQTFANPYGTSPPVELPMTHKYYWQDRNGRFVGTDDPSANPNVGSTGEWRRMERVTR